MCRLVVLLHLLSHRTWFRYWMRRIRIPMSLFIYSATISLTWNFPSWKRHIHIIRSMAIFFSLVVFIFQLSMVFIALKFNSFVTTRSNSLFFFSHFVVAFGRKVVDFFFHPLVQCLVLLNHSFNFLFTRFSNSCACVCSFNLAFSYICLSSGWFRISVRSHCVSSFNLFSCCCYCYCWWWWLYVCFYDFFSPFFVLISKMVFI